jgi:hypothetical protein
VRFGLVDNFFSSGHIGQEEKESQDLLHKIFACLRLLKPTRNGFSAIQLKWIERDQADVFSFTHPEEHLLE